MTSPRVFAIGFKQWIELRAAHQPPTALTTKFEKPMKVRVFDGYNYGEDGWVGRPKYKMMSEKLVVNVTSHVGGRVLCTLKRRKFVALTRMTGVGNGKMKELPIQLVGVFLNREWRRKYARR